MHQLLLDLAPLPAASLSNFAVGRNAEVLRALRAWLAGDEEPILYLWGPPGSGKSHLLSGAVVESRSQGTDVLSVPVSVLCASHGRARIGTALAIDDVQAVSEAGQAALFTLLNRAAQSELRL